MKYIKRYVHLAIALGISAAILVAELIIGSVSKATVIKEHSNDNYSKITSNTHLICNFNKQIFITERCHMYPT